MYLGVARICLDKSVNPASTHPQLIELGEEGVGPYEKASGVRQNGRGKGLGGK